MKIKVEHELINKNENKRLVRKGKEEPFEPWTQEIKDENGAVTEQSEPKLIKHIEKKEKISLYSNKKQHRVKSFEEYKEDFYDPRDEFG